MVYAEGTKLEAITGDLLARGVVRESDSDHSSRVVLTRKKNGSLRMGVDYRPLSKYLEPENFSVPLIGGKSGTLKGKEYFSQIDLKDGLYLVGMVEDSVKYTSFVTPDERFEFLKMPFGLKVTAQHTLELVRAAFRELIDSGDLTVNFGGILIATEGMKHRLGVLRRVFKIIDENKLEVQLLKVAVVGF